MILRQETSEVSELVTACLTPVQLPGCGAGRERQWSLRVSLGERKSGEPREMKVVEHSRGEMHTD